MKNKAVRVLLSWAKVITIVVLIVVLLRTFVFDISRVHQTSMEGSLYDGDIVITSMLNYGGKTTTKPLTVPLSDLFFEGGISSDAVRLKPFQIPGIKPVYYNDVVYIESPIQSDSLGINHTQYAERVVALPGDTFQLKNRDVQVGKDLLIEPEEIKFLHEIKVNKGFETKTLQQLEITKWEQVDNTVYLAFLTSKQASILMKIGTVRYAKEVRTRHADQAPHYLEETHHQWNDQRFGPYWIPKAGEIIELNKENWELYADIINHYEGVNLTFEEDKFYVDGVEREQYMFNKDYLFVLSDNRDNGIDSRHFGPIPKDHLIGKVTVVLFSFRSERESFLQMIRPNRILLEVK